MKLGTMERLALRKAVRAHPDVKEHVSKPADVNALPKDRLIAVAEALGIDVEAAIQGDGSDPLEGSYNTIEGQELARYSERYPAFVGELPFDLVIELLGHSVTRQARIEYAFTPDWEYFDLNKGEPMRGWDSSKIGIEILAEPSGERYDVDDAGKLRRRKAKPTWIKADLLGDGVLPDAVLDDIYTRIEEAARLEDARRRSTARPV